MNHRTWSRAELLEWSNGYDTEHPWWVKRELELGERIRSKKMLTVSDLTDIIQWKFDMIEGRRQHFSKVVKRNDEKMVMKVSSIALDLDKKLDAQRMALLCVLIGVGPAVASVILTFYDPDNYGVFDIHVWRELFGKEPKIVLTPKKLPHLSKRGKSNRTRNRVKRQNCGEGNLQEKLYGK